MPIPLSPTPATPEWDFSALTIFSLAVRRVGSAFDRGGVDKMMEDDGFQAFGWEVQKFYS